MATDRYSSLLEFLVGSTREEFNVWLRRVDPAKLNFWFLLSLLGGGSYNVSYRASILLILIDPDDYDYHALLYFRNTGDPRAFECLESLIERVPEHKREAKGRESFEREG